MNIAIKNADRLLYKDGRFSASRGDIYITDDRIASLSTAPEGFSADRIIDASGKLVIPGLVNSHTHSYMNLFRNCADDLSFSDWLFGRILPLEDKMTPEDIYYGALLGDIEMIKSGTTSFIDMHPYKIETARAARDIGLRGIISRGLVDSDSMEGGIDRINQTREEISVFRDEPLITFMIAPHAVYTCSREYLLVIKDYLNETKLPMNIHLCETADEIKGIKEKYNCTPVEYLENLGLLEQHTVAAHCVYLTENDIALMSKKDLFVATNPKSNLKLGNGIAPVSKLVDAGVPVCIGTDGAASNNTLNMFSEMNFAALLQKGTTHTPTVMDAHTTLKCATINGANAAMVDSGEISVGKKADLAIIDLDNPQFYPRTDIVPALVYSAGGNEVETVIINGNIVMENRRITLINEDEVYEKCCHIYERINKSI